MTFRQVKVFSIRDPSSSYSSKRLNGTVLRFTAYQETTIKSLKQFVATMTGLPPEQQKYHGRSSVWGSGEWMFDTVAILLGDDDGDNNLPLLRTLNDLFSKGIIRSHHEIAVVSPSPPAAERSNPRDEEEQAEDVQLVRQVDPVEERIAAGRENAIVIDDSESESESKSSDEEGLFSSRPQPKRARRTKTVQASVSVTPERCTSCLGTKAADNGRSSSGRETQTGASGGILDVNHSQRTATSQDGVGCEAAENLGTVKRSDDDSRDVTLTRISGSNQAISEVEQVVDRARDNVEGDNGQRDTELRASELRQWLRRIDKEEGHGNHLEKQYFAAFEKHFVTIASLKRAASCTRVGVDRILRECGVEKLGDVALLDDAISKL